MNYSNIISKIKPLDLIFFRGNNIISDIISDAERFQSKPPNDTIVWSHVGIVINTDILPNIKNAKNNTLYIWESTYSGNLATKDNISINTLSNKIYDIESNKPIFGVQIRELDLVIKSYLSSNGLVGHGQLINNPFDTKFGEWPSIFLQRKNDMINILTNLHIKYQYTPYELSPIDCLSFVCSCIRPLRPIFGTTDKIVCSEFITIIYQSLNIIPNTINPRNITPFDLSNPEFSENSDKKNGLINILLPITSIIL